MRVLGIEGMMREAEKGVALSRLWVVLTAMELRAGKGRAGLITESKLEGGCRKQVHPGVALVVGKERANANYSLLAAPSLANRPGMISSLHPSYWCNLPLNFFWFRVASPPNPIRPPRQPRLFFPLSLPPYVILSTMQPFPCPFTAVPRLNGSEAVSIIHPPHPTTLPPPRQGRHGPEGNGE